MSDYLGHLIARTLTPAAVVRPQLPSLFEPSLASGQIRSELEFERESVFESPAIMHRASDQSPILTPRAPDPPSILVPSQSVLLDPEAITPQTSRPKGIHRAAESNSVPLRAESNVAPTAAGSPKNDLRAGQLESSSRRAPASDAPTSVSQLSTRDSQPKIPSLVKPAVAPQEIRAVKAVVPALRALPQFPSTPMPAAAPTINVTIGRVEIRATSQPTPPPRARPNSANVLSLEDYLRQRAKGGGR